MSENTWKPFIYYSGSSPLIVYGGSFCLGPRKFHDDPAIGFGDAYGDQSLFDLSAEGPADGISPAVGFRCFCKSRVIPFSGIDSVCRV